MVTTDIPGCRDICADGVNGLLVQPRSARLLADALHRLLTDAGLHESMGQVGPLRVAEQFSLQAIVRATIAVYRERQAVEPTSVSDRL